MDYNWLTPKAQARPAGGKGWGSFVVEPIAKGETVVGFGGWVVDRTTLATMDDDRQSRSIQVDHDLFIVSSETPEPGDMLNHSCEPNCGVVGSMVLVAMRDIEPGEELTFDYAMTDASDYDEFACLCGVPTCRGVVTGADWRDPVLQAKYHGYFSQYLMQRISALTDAY
jgi:SET domain-containing protein